MSKYRIKVQTENVTRYFTDPYVNPKYSVQKRTLFIFWYNVTAHLSKDQALQFLNELNSFA